MRRPSRIRLSVDFLASGLGFSGTWGDPVVRTMGMLLFWAVIMGAQMAQQNASIHGTLLERDAQTASGEFSVRLPDHEVLRYRFDGRTRVERNGQAIDVARLRLGDKLEVVSQEITGSPLRYASAIRVDSVREPPTAVGPVPSGRIRTAYSNSVDRFLPTATLALSGVVLRSNAEHVILHTRDAGDETVLLRPDTRYLENGNVVEAGALKPNMRVFISAGRTLYNEIEAYQVVWGQILLPN